MANRTTDEAVRKLIELDEDFDTSPFIETANSVVTDVCSDSEYSDVKLELIERWLSAHFCSMQEPLAKTETVRGISVTYEGQTSLGLKFTRYGQQAMIIDTAGNLRALDESKGGKVGISWIGSSDPYYDD